jgi:hypothetical protein
LAVMSLFDRCEFKCGEDRGCILALLRRLSA